VHAHPYPDGFSRTFRFVTFSLFFLPLFPAPFSSRHSRLLLQGLFLMCATHTLDDVPPFFSNHPFRLIKPARHSGSFSLFLVWRPPPFPPPTFSFGVIGGGGALPFTPKFRGLPCLLTGFLGIQQGMCAISFSLPTLSNSCQHCPRCTTIGFLCAHSLPPPPNFLRIPPSLSVHAPNNQLLSLGFFHGCTTIFFVTIYYFARSFRGT